MSDGGTSGAGWQPDPDGRHEYRWWDGSSWTDQVADGGVTSTDPPGSAPTVPVTPVGPSPTDTTTTVPPVAGPPGGVYPTGDPLGMGGPGTAPPQKSKASVGLLALIGVVVAAIVAAVVIFALGGDDGGGDGDEVATASDDASSADSSDDLSEDASDDTSDVLTNDFSDDATSDFSDDVTDDTGQVPANNLRVGECLEDEAAVTNGETVDCGTPHVFEVYGRFDVDGESFPGDTALQTEGQRCLESLFEDYVGLPYSQSEIYATPLVPTAETWTVGDRTVICLAHTQDQTPTTGSVEGANR